MLKIIDHELIRTSIENAVKSQRKRMNYNFHLTFEDPINRMLNAMEPGSYVRPHKHENPNKREVFIILCGSILIVIFDDQGNIIQHLLLNNSTDNYGIEIPEKTWHMAISLQSGSVVYEIKDGPYSPIDDKNFAPWAPEEGNQACHQFLKNILTKLNY